MKPRLIRSRFRYAVLTAALLLSQNSLYSHEEVRAIEEVEELIIKVPCEEKQAQELISEEIRLQLNTQEHEAYRAELFDLDLKNLSQHYEKIKPTLRKEGKKIYITLELSPKKVLHEIIWRGTKKISPNLLKKECSLKKGELVDEIALENACRMIKQFYLKKGYYKAQVSYTIEPSKEYRQVNVQFNIDEGPLGIVRKVSFTGIEPKLAKEIKGKLITQRHTLLGKITGRGRFIEEALEYDSAHVIRILQNEGYVDAYASFEVRPLPQKRGIEVICHVTKGSQYHIGQIELKANVQEDLSFTRDLFLSISGIKEGAPYSPDKLQEANQAISDYLGARGYADASAYFIPKLDGVDSTEFDLVFHVDPGTRYKVGMLHFSGNYITRPRVLIHESLVVPGDLLNTKKIEATEKRLSNTELFSSVHIRTTPSEEETLKKGDYKDIHIDLEENPSTGKFSLQLGANNTEGAYLGAEIAENNFYLGGYKNIPKKGLRAMRGNGEYLSFKTTVASHSKQSSFSWTQPYFKDSAWSVGVDYDYGERRVSNANYDTHNKGITLFGFYPLHDFLRLKLSTSLRNDYLHAKPQATQDIQNQERYNGPSASIGAALIYNSTNHFLYPTKGWKSTTGLSTTRMFDQDTQFAYGYYENSLYFPVANKTVLKIRADIRAIYPFGNSKTADDLPLTQKLFEGGDDSVRGFRYGTIGPLFSNGTGRGGISSYLYSVEVLKRIHPQMGFFIFTDTAMVSEKKFHIAHPYSSAGWGVRFDIMNKFPLIFGYGYPFKTNHRPQLKRFFFTIGGRF